MKEVKEVKEVKKNIKEVEENEQIVCSHCRKIIKSDENWYQTDNDYILCDNCNNICSICDDCGTLVLTDNTVLIDGGDGLCCSECAKKYYCEQCEGYHSNVQKYKTENGSVQLCLNCQYYHYYYCDKCGLLIYEDDTNDINEHHYCNECYESMKKMNEFFINDYSFKPDARFYKTQKDKELNVLYFGSEIELEKISDTFCNDILKITKGTYLEDMFYFKEDGSLEDGNSVEMVSHPFTYYFLIENIKTFKKVFDYINKNSETSSRTGLHFHMSRGYFENEDTIDKFMLFFEYYMKEIKTLSLRERYSYCEFMQNRLYFNEIDKKLFITKKGVNNSKNKLDRYSCINITNLNTIECRIFASTTSINIFIAYIEFLKSLVNLCKTRKETTFGFATILKQEDTTYINDFIKAIGLTVPKGNMKNNEVLLIRENNKKKKKIIEQIDKLNKLISNNIGQISKKDNIAMRDYYINFELMRIKKYLSKYSRNKYIDRYTTENLVEYIDSRIYSVKCMLRTNEFTKKQLKIITELEYICSVLNELKKEVI